MSCHDDHADGLAVLGTVAASRAGQGVTTESLADGYALGLILDGVLLAAAVLVALVVLRPTHSATATGQTGHTEPTSEKGRS